MHPDRKRAVVGGILSGLGIKPKRPSTIEERLTNALKQAESNE